MRSAHQASPRCSISALSPDTIALRAAFTLVEMLVAVTLVLIMMTMFAQVFQMAGSSISRQRGLAENDQRCRTLTTIIKADLDKRSFRWVYPFAAGEDVGLPESYVNKRQGYFYYSENNPYNDLDDVLQFTISSTITDRNRDDTPYYGQALNLSGGDFTYANQPDADDAQLTMNNTGLSTVAEVVYFVRNGNLYRRQLLIREPLATAGTNPQPTDATFDNPNGKDSFDSSLSPGSAIPYSATGPFWNDFDYSAYYDNLTGSAKFLGSDALDNSGSTAAGTFAAPYRRFGFSHAGAGTNSGRPKEYAENAPASAFIGRFTLQECSDSDFRYPQNTTTAGDIPVDPTLALTLDANDYSVIGPNDNFAQGPRRGEDLLLPNVHSFDVQIWDSGVNRFVNIGDPSLPVAADFDVGGSGSQLNPYYGPRLAGAISTPLVINAVFDTWHPQIDIDYDSDGANYDLSDATIEEVPPFLPRYYDPTSLIWTADTAYTRGSVVFPTVVPNGAPIFYRCIGTVDSDMSGATRSGMSEPVWPTTESLTIVDNELVWQAVDNRKPLKAIKLEIRFIDPSTQQMRQLTIVHSLVD